MPIKGLSDKNTRSNQSLSIPTWGRFRKGDEKPERGVGKNLDYFRIDWDDLQAQTAFEAIYGDKPDKLMIATVGHSVEAVFDTWYRLYGSNNALQRKCDGHTVAKAADASLAGRGCICTPDNRKCSEQGYFYFTIPEVCKQLGYIGQFILGTGSPIEIIEMSALLEAVFQSQGSLNFAPFIMQRKSRAFDKTDDRGRPVRYIQSMVQLVPPIEALFPTLAPALPQPESAQPQLPEQTGTETKTETGTETGTEIDPFTILTKKIETIFGQSITSLYTRFYADDPELTLSPAEDYARHDNEQEYLFELLLRCVDGGIPMRMNTIQYDSNKKRHVMQIFGYKVLMFSRDVLREANALPSLIKGLEKQGLVMTKDLAYSLDELPYMYIKDSTNDAGEHMYFSVTQIRFPEKYGQASSPAQSNESFIPPKQGATDDEIFDDNGFPM